MDKTRREISEYISDHEPDINKWYIGTTKKTDARAALFHTHKVDEENDWWIYRTTESDDIASDVLKHFISKGAVNKNPESGPVVYAYIMTDHSTP